uniref:Uncharacterized protein n=1 Tax=Arundo donax TaxID=35708 RepID=A0A0A9AQA3_ARUDO
MKQQQVTINLVNCFRLFYHPPPPKLSSPFELSSVSQQQTSLVLFGISYFLRREEFHQNTKKCPLRSNLAKFSGKCRQ